MNVSARIGNRKLETVVGRPNISLRQAVALILFVTLASLFYAYTEIRSLQIGYEISRGYETQRELREVGRRLKVELNNLRSPERLEEEGRRLGLFPPSDAQRRVLP